MNTNTALADFESKLASFIVGCQAIIDDYEKDLKLPYTTKLETMTGKRYIRVVRREYIDGKPREHSGSVHCFVDTTNGNVLKAANWTTPAKGARGNIFDDKNSLAVMTQFGAAYLR